MKFRIHEDVLAMKAAVGRTEHECLSPIPGCMITNSEPQVSRAPETEAHDHPIDENHDQAELVLAGIGEVCRRKED